MNDREKQLTVKRPGAPSPRRRGPRGRAGDPPLPQENPPECLDKCVHRPGQSWEHPEEQLCDGEVKIGVGIGFVSHGVMPPFALVGLETAVLHN